MLQGPRSVILYVRKDEILWYKVKMSTFLLQEKCSTLLTRKCQFFGILLLWVELGGSWGGKGIVSLFDWVLADLAIAHPPSHPSPNTLKQNILMKNACPKPLNNLNEIWLLLYLKWREPEIALEYNLVIGLLHLCCENKYNQY